MPYEYLIEHDRNLLNATSIVIKPFRGRSYVLAPDNLQFPIKITNESKSANWNEKDVAAYEPLALWMGAGARELKIELEYVVPSNIWTPDRVADITRNIKSYMYQASVAKQFDSYPVVEVEYTNIIPTAAGKKLNFRLISYSAEYSETVVEYNGSYWPQHTKITLDLKMQTKITVNEDRSASNNDESAQMDAEPLRAIQVEWY